MLIVVISKGIVCDYYENVNVVEVGLLGLAVMMIAMIITMMGIRLCLRGGWMLEGVSCASTRCVDKNFSL